MHHIKQKKWQKLLSYALAGVAMGTGMIIMPATARAQTVTQGGDGGDGSPYTDGFIGSATTGVTINADGDYSVIGGNGGSSSYGISGGGAGGAGGSATNSITNNAAYNNSNLTITGGDGGDGGDAYYITNGYHGYNGAPGGSGGSALLSITDSGSPLTLSNSSLTLTGGNGGDGGIGNNGYIGGDGGSGGNASFSGNIDAIDSVLTLIGGSDGVDGSGYGYAGAGGAGGSVYILGSVTGNGHSTIDLQTNGNGSIKSSLTLNDTSVLKVRGYNEIYPGNLTLNAGTTYSPFLDVNNPDGNYLAVFAGNVFLNNAYLTPDISNATAGDFTNNTFKILEYQQDLIGTFSDDQSASPLFYTVDYGDGYGGEIDISITGVNPNPIPQGSGIDVGGSPSQNAQNLADYFNGPDGLISQEGTGNLSNILQIIQGNGINEIIPDNIAAQLLQTFFNQQSFTGGILDTLRNLGNHLDNGKSTFALNNSGNISTQLSSLRQSMNAPAYALNAAGNNNSGANGMWASYNGRRSSMEADHGIGSNSWSASNDGFTVGYTNGGGNFRWGLAAGHQETDLDFDGISASGKVEGYNVGLYGSWQGKSTFLNAVLGYGDYNNQSYQLLGNNKFDTKAYSGTLELGKHYGSDHSQITPFASIDWTRTKNDGFTNPGGGLSIRNGSNNVYSTTLGVRYNNRQYDDAGKLKGGWTAGLGWVHQSGDTNFAVGASYSPTFPDSFNASTTPLDGNLLQAKIGAYGRIHNNLIGFAGYEGLFGSSQRVHSVNAGIGYQF